MWPDPTQAGGTEVVLQVCPTGGPAVTIGQPAADVQNCTTPDSKQRPIRPNPPCNQSVVFHAWSTLCQTMQNRCPINALPGLNLPYSVELTLIMNKLH